MIAGQYWDMNVGRQPQEKRTEELLEKIHRFKTGALLGASVCLGALHVLSLPEFEKKEAALFEWGASLGLLFQISDDLLDQKSTRAVLGKTPAKDFEQDKLTYALFMNEKEIEKKVLEIKNQMSLGPASLQAPILKSLLNFVLERSS
jgi:geranylgeranyl diphosphate synthase, type II